MIALLATPLGRAVAALLGCAVAALAIFGAGYWLSNLSTNNERLEDTVNAYENRKQIDEHVETLSPRGLCLALGGLPDDCPELRGLDETARGQ